MQKKVMWIAVGIVVVAVVAGGYLVFSKKSDNNQTTTNPTTNATTPSANSSNSSATIAATIIYDGNGFSPSTTVVKAGDTVAIKNTSSNTLQFDSDPHPVHTDDTDLNVGTVKPGETTTFTVTKTGTHGVHNHLDPSQTAKITIQ